MKFTGHLDGEKVTFALDDAGRLIVTHADGSEDTYNEEYYTDDSYFTIRDMLNRDGVRNLADT